MFPVGAVKYGSRTQQGETAAYAATGLWTEDNAETRALSGCKGQWQTAQAESWHSHGCLGNRQIRSSRIAQNDQLNRAATYWDTAEAYA